MNRLALIQAFIWLIPAAAVSQDDIYFVPSEHHSEPVETVAPAETFYCGSVRDVDEYNRRCTYYHEIDSAGNDIIDFDGVAGVYPDSLNDYVCTRQMCRFDDYSWSDSYWAGYSDGRWDSWRWNDPWYYGYWYDPWFYTGWYYSPWRYHYGWYPYHHFWYAGSYYRPYRGITGTSNHGFVNRGGRVLNGNGFRGYRGNSNTTPGNNRNVVRNFSGNRNTNRVNTNTTRQPSFSGGNSFGGSRGGGSFSGSRGGGGGGSRGGFSGRR